MILKLSEQFSTSKMPDNCSDFLSDHSLRTGFFIFLKVENT